MKELTRIITMQITGIAKVEDNEKYIPKEQAAADIARMVKENVPEADDVVVTVQDFELDLEEGADHGEEQ